MEKIYSFILAAFCCLGLVGCGGGEEDAAADDGTGAVADGTGGADGTDASSDPSAGGDVVNDPSAGGTSGSSDGGDGSDDGSKAGEKTDNPEPKPRPPRERTKPRMRTWTDHTGRNRFKAKFVSVKGNKVHMQLPDGKPRVEDFEKLSKYDLLHVHTDLKVKSKELKTFLKIQEEAPKKEEKKKGEEA